MAFVFSGRYESLSDLVVVTEDGPVYSQKLVLLYLLPQLRELVSSTSLSDHDQVIIHIPHLQRVDVEAALEEFYLHGMVGIFESLLEELFDKDESQYAEYSQALEQVRPGFNAQGTKAIKI